MKILELIPQIKALLQHYSHQLLGHSKHIFMVFFSHFSPLVDHEQNNSASRTTAAAADNPSGGLAEENYEFNWSTSLIPLPLHYITDSIKKQLPVMEYSSFLLQNKKSSAGNINGDDHRHDECAVCLNSVKATHEVRELWNCSHVFHKDCLDGWIDKSNLTCPLCRADLLPAAASSDKDDELNKCPVGEDPRQINDAVDDQLPVW